MERVELSHPYIGIFFMVISTFVVYNLVIFLARKIGNSLSGNDGKKLKRAMYECGPIPIMQKNSLNINYFLVAILFIVFDLEIVFLVPWALVSKDLGTFGFYVASSFLFTLIVGFIYELRKGALKWQHIK